MILFQDKIPQCVHITLQLILQKRILNIENSVEYIIEYIIDKLNKQYNTYFSTVSYHRQCNWLVNHLIQ